MAKLRTVLTLLGCALAVTARRLARGPRRPGWSWFLEFMTKFMRSQLRALAGVPDPAAQRAYLDALPFPSPALRKVRVEPVQAGAAAARWFLPPGGSAEATLLYFHGGGYLFNSSGQDHLVALLALATGVRVLSVDYRLAPEHPFPAAVDDALEAYRFLLGAGTKPERIVAAGDSAGGGLAAALLLSLRDRGEPLPALAVLLSPWVDLADDSGAPPGDSADWIDPSGVGFLRDCYLAGQDPRHPLASPLHGDLRGLPPLYIQAGGAEVLVTQIRAFAAKARSQGVDARLDEWEHMNHVFQFFAPNVAHSAKALSRIGREVRQVATGGAPTPRAGT